MSQDRLKSPHGPVLAAGAASAIFILMMAIVPVRETSVRADMIQASRLMARAETAVQDCRAQKGISADKTADPNLTGLIGLETSPITTSLGNIAAKRTTTNPDFAGLVVSLLAEAGVRKGDVVAVGASSSFPALIIATLSAARAMGIRPLVISSLGASEWGANNPDFNWLDIDDCLRQAGILEVRPIALAVGGDEDVGRDMSPAGRELLRARIRESGIPFIEKSSLKTNVDERLGLYEEAAGGRPIQAFVNIGGSWANSGTNAEVLKLKPGRLRDIFIPPPDERGVLQAMAARGIPVIHLLNIRGLCERYGLPWDPKPLPTPGEGEIDKRAGARGSLFVILSGVYMLTIISFMIWARLRRRTAS
jgi:poly-gamma-glutamate system protein